MVGGLSIVFPYKDVVDETNSRKFTNVCKAIVGIDSSRLYPRFVSLCLQDPGQQSSLTKECKMKRDLGRIA